MSGNMPRLGQLLVKAGAVTEDQLRRALAEQSSWGDRLGQNLLSLGFIDEPTLVAAVAQQTGLPALDLDNATLPANASQLLPLSLAERFGLMPLQLRESPRALQLACYDPTNEEALREVRNATGHALELWVTSASAIDRAIRRYYYGEAPQVGGPKADPLINVTRNSLSTGAVGAPGSIEQRLADLERKVEELTRVVGDFTGRMR